MNARRLAIASLVLWAATVLVAAFFFVRGWTSTSSDHRAEVKLAPAEVDLVLGEMRGILTSVNGVVSGLSAGDMKRVQEAAKASGMGMAVDVNPALMAKLPMEFKEMGMGLHRGFDALAEGVEMGESTQQVLQRLTELTSRCVACHQAYRLSGAGPSSTARLEGARGASEGFLAAALRETR